jgi:predicted nucleic acid-binding protein
VLLLDASGFVAALLPNQPAHRAAASALSAEEGPLVLSPFVLGEVDCLVQKYAGVATEVALLEQVEQRAYELVAFGADDVAAARRVIARYADLRIGLADASIVVLAGRYRTDRVLTLDERHFRALRTPSGAPFTLLPADA